MNWSNRRNSTASLRSLGNEEGAEEWNWKGRDRKGKRPGRRQKDLGADLGIVCISEVRETPISKGATMSTLHYLVQNSR